ncbi:MAG: AAA family ATPase [Spirochaetales bacterium]|nr:AAA family ATPase [Spirochaetales bacterium]
MKNKSRNKVIEKRLKGKTLAFASGKGGVGKTTTSANLGIYYARRGFRVAIVDLDPLSDIPSLFDLRDAEHALTEKRKKIKKFSDIRLPAFSGLDLILPPTSEDPCDLLFSTFLETLDSAYDLLLFDLPAGLGWDVNLKYLNRIGQLVLVTNPEPTAHVSAGSYIRKALTETEIKKVLIWHNKFENKSHCTFNPLDIMGNYNRNVAASEQYFPETGILEDIARIPHDPSLDLLEGNPALPLLIQRKLLATLKGFQGRRLFSIPPAMNISPRTLELIRYYILNNPEIYGENDYLEGLGNYLEELLVSVSPEEKRRKGLLLFTAAEKQQLIKYLTLIRKDPLWIVLGKLIRLMDLHLKGMEEAKRLFTVEKRGPSNKAVDRELTRFLISLNKLAGRGMKEIAADGGLLLFYFSLNKLFQSPTVQSLISDFIPVRENGKKEPSRDRHKQIQSLIRNDTVYQQDYFKLIKTMYPVITRQLHMIIKTLELKNLAFTNSDGQTDGRIYLKLLTDFIHDTIYAGLGVVVGFDYRAAATSFEKAAEELLKRITPGRGQSS